MNFLVALLLLAVSDEVLAFVLLKKLMKDMKWRAVYLDGLNELFVITEKLKKWFMTREKVIQVKMDACGILLEALLASPVMGLFANLLPLQHSLRVLDRFLYFGEEALINIVKEAYSVNKSEILKIREAFDLQIYCTRKIYFDAIQKKKLFPPIKRGLFGWIKIIFIYRL